MCIRDSAIAAVFFRDAACDCTGMMYKLVLVCLKLLRVRCSGKMSRTRNWSAQMHNDQHNARSVGSIGSARESRGSAARVCRVHANPSKCGSCSAECNCRGPSHASPQRARCVAGRVCFFSSENPLPPVSRHSSRDWFAYRRAIPLENPGMQRSQHFSSSQRPSEAMLQCS